MDIPCITILGLPQWNYKTPYHEFLVCGLDSLISEYKYPANVAAMSFRIGCRS